MIRSAACDGLAALRDTAAVGWLTETAKYGKPSRGRRAAIAALGRLGESRAVREQLEDLLQDPEFYIRVQAAQALVQFGDARAISALEARLCIEKEGRVVRVIRESLLSLAANAADSVRKLTDDVTNLQRKLDEMRVRVERVEASRGAPPRAEPAHRVDAAPVPKPIARAKSNSRKTVGSAQPKTNKQKASPKPASKRAATRARSSAKKKTSKRR
jgi:hypothetical protein